MKKMAWAPCKSTNCAYDFPQDNHYASAHIRIHLRCIAHFTLQNIKRIFTQEMKFNNIYNFYCFIKDVLKDNWHVLFLALFCLLLWMCGTEEYHDYNYHHLDS